MNIDYFFIYDIYDVDIVFLNGLLFEFGVCEYLDDEFMIQGGIDYLMEFCDDWFKLIFLIVLGKLNEVNQDGKKGRIRKLKCKDFWGE